GEQLILDITLLGAVERGHAILRSGARVGDVLCVTGTPGDSAAGLYAQLHPNLSYAPEALAAVRRRQCLPQPRVREGRILSRLGTGIVTAMLDVSDGLSGDLSHLCERSSVGARLEAARLPISDAAREIAASACVEPLQWALHGGEDYELLFTVLSGYELVVARTIEAATGTPVTVIGNILPQEDGMQLVSLEGNVERLQPRGWEHLTSDKMIEPDKGKL
ncbi:MAG TPA: AIR synthase-related protein, partial [Ktedonobacteraceae bacterium]|nr:AIR synthase-related protein [Ktedonobacteraceae bacterium]